MAIREYPSVRAEIPVDQISTGAAQVSTDPRRLGDLDDLAGSIKQNGLLQPILLHQTADDEYEVIAGQRRFLAHQRLKLSTIEAKVYTGDLSEVDKVVISLSENLCRRDNYSHETITACTQLYRHFGQLKLVADYLGISPNTVSKYVKFDQLVPELKRLVEETGLDMNTALQANKAAMSEDGDVNVEAATKFAEELRPMSNQQRSKFVRAAAAAGPEVSIEERIELARKQPVQKQIVVTLEESRRTGLKEFAESEEHTQDEAAAILIEDGLVRRGFIEV